MAARTSHTNYEALIDCAYHAAFEESLWPEFLDRFADALSGQNTALIIQDLQPGQNNAQTCVRTDLEQLRQYNEYYCHINPWIQHGYAHLAGGTVGVGEMHYSTEELIRTEFYDGWLRPQKLKHSIAAAVYHSERRIVLCSTLRTAAAGPFGKEHVDFFGAILPHVRRALMTRERVRDVFDAGHRALELLENLPQACVLVSREARPVFVNRAARNALAAGKVSLRLGPAGLAAARQQDTAELHRLISRAAGPVASGGEMAIYRERGLPLLILVSPIHGSYQLPAPPQAVAAVWISDPDDKPLSKATRIKALFRLTYAEASLTCEVARGMSLADVADARQISLHTVRNQLKSIFTKTGARTQADLVRLVLACPDLNP